MIPVVLFFQGMVNSLRFSSMNTLTLKDLPPRLASGGNSLLSMVMQLSMSIGVTIAGILIGMYAHHQVSGGSAAIHSVFMYATFRWRWLSPCPPGFCTRPAEDTTKNVVIDRAREAGSPDPMRKS